MDTSPRLPLLDERQAAALLSVSPRTLQSWRVRGCGPSFVRVGSRIRYCPGAIERWLKVRRATIAASRKPRPITLAHRPVLSPRMVELVTNELKRGTAGEVYLGATAYRRLLQVLEPNAATFARVLSREVTVGAGGTIRLIIPRNSGFTDAHLEVNADAASRTIEVVWTTGAAVRRARWDGYDNATPFDEVLLVTDAAIDLSRLKTGAPVLDSHVIGSVSAQRAVVDDAWLSGGKGYARLRFPTVGTDVEADRLFEMAKQKIIRNISVGYKINKLRVVAAKGAAEVERRIIESWTPYELSFVTVPAEGLSQTRI